VLQQQRYLPQQHDRHLLLVRTPAVQPIDLLPVERSVPGSRHLLPDESEHVHHAQRTGVL
jgi:hypothetical protein